MRWEVWEPLLAKVRAEFGYSEADDLACARRLDAILGRMEPPPVVDYAWQMLNGARVEVVGAADDADEAVRAARRSRPLVVADGATSAARAVGRVPDVVVTDLDGAVDDQVWAARKGALVFVHAHGDNRERIEEWVPRFPANAIAGTCQVKAFGRLVNPGGFTDGDRACFLAHALGAKSARLGAFAFGGPVGKWSGEKATETKMHKLSWARRLLAFLQSETGFNLEPSLLEEDSADAQSA